MSTSTLPEQPPQLAEPDTAAESGVEARLSRLEEAVDRSAREGRNAGRAFTIFAVAALGLAMVTFAAVLAKLPGSSTPSAPVRAAAPSTASSAAAAAPAARGIGVSLAEYTVTPSPAVGQAGRVTFTVRNDGTIRHEFVVVRTPKAAGDLLKGAEADETGNVGELGGLAPGQTKKLSLVLKPGHYALICNLPGHYAAGQHADFTVR